MENQKIGEVIHYFDKISVAVIRLDDSLSIGDDVKIKGSTTDVEQSIASMQIDKVDVERCDAGQEVAIKVDGRVREGDEVFRI